MQTQGHSDISSSDNLNSKFPCLYKITPSNIFRVWKIIKPKVEVALKHGIHANDSNFVFEQLYKGHAKFWLNKDSWIISTMEDLNIGKCITIWLASGDKYNLLSMYDLISQWAKKQGCKNMLINGREGWVRFLKKSNFKPMPILRKEL